MNNTKRQYIYFEIKQDDTLIQRIDITDVDICHMNRIKGQLTYQLTDKQRLLIEKYEEKQQT